MSSCWLLWYKSSPAKVALRRCDSSRSPRLSQSTLPESCHGQPHESNRLGRIVGAGGSCIRGTDTVSRILSGDLSPPRHWESPISSSSCKVALGEARAVLPDRLAQFPALRRPVYAMDRQGCRSKGHAHHVRLGCPTDVHVVIHAINRRIAPTAPSTVRRAARHHLRSSRCGHLMTNDSNPAAHCGTPARTSGIPPAHVPRMGQHGIFLTSPALLQALFSQTSLPGAL
jgi:hypothetical protein